MSTIEPTAALAAADRRNVVDHYKGLPHQAIVADLDEHGSALHIAIDDDGHVSARALSPNG